MKQSDLKKVLKPLIKQCIKEVIFEEGVLSGIISEVVKGTGGNNLVLGKKPLPVEEQATPREKKQPEKNKINLQETRKKMLDAIGKDSFNGVDLFEGTSPLTKAGSPGTGGMVSTPLEQYAPDDAGVDISDLFDPRWKQMV